MSKYFSKNLRFLRLKKGLTQDELAQKINKKKSIIGNYENGGVLPNIQIIKQIAGLFEINWVDLVEVDLTLYAKYHLKEDINTVDEEKASYSNLNKEIELKDKLLKALESENKLLKEQIVALKAQIVKLKAQN